MSRDSEITVRANGPGEIAHHEGVAQALVQLGQAMQGLATMMSNTNERMGRLENAVQLLTKVTPMQAGAINKAIRERAREMCEAHRAPGGEAQAQNAIRREVRLAFGVQSVRELPRCEYQVALRQVQLWEDYRAMKTIKSKVGAKA